METRSDGNVPIEQVVLEIDLHIEQALSFIEQDNLPAALISLNRALVDAPDERLAECYSLRGYVHLKQGDFKRAETDCSEAISRDWSDAQTLAWRAAAFGEQNAWAAAFDDLSSACEAAGNEKDHYLRLMESYIETASEHFRQQIIAGRDSADLFYDRGWVYFRAGKKVKAERDFGQALSKDPNHWQAALGMAGLKLDDGQASEALALTTTAMNGGPKALKRSLFLRAKANQHLGNNRQVTKDLSELKKIAAGDVACLFEIGKLRLELGEKVRAISDMNSVLKSNPRMQEALVVRGDAYQAIQNYALAINDYSKYLRRNPDSVQTRLRRGQAYLKTNQLDRAAADFDRSLELDAVCGEAFLGRSQVFLATNQLDHALTECQKASRLDNQKAEVFGTLAEIHYQLCDYSLAIEDFIRAERLSASNVDKSQYCYRRANAYYQLDQLDESLRYFRKATKLNPNHAGAWIWKAQVCSKLEKWSKAILGLEQAIRSKPVEANAYLELGKPVAQKAITHFSRMAQRGNETVEVYRSRGLAHQFLGKHPEAIQDYSKALALREDTDVRIRRGRCLIQELDFDAGLADFKQVIDAEPDHHVARFWRADAYRQNHQQDRALSDIVKAIKLEATDPRYFLLHAELMAQKQEWLKAVRSLEQAIRYDARNPVLFYHRGMVYQELGKTNRAISDFNRSLEISNDQPVLLTQRGRAYLSQGNHQLAMQDFEAAIALDQQQYQAYCERGAAMAADSQYETALIWLSKTLHRFEEPRALATILFQRGNIFLQTGRNTRAINDYCLAIDRIRDDREMVARIRLKRATAYAADEKFDEAASDLERVFKRQPDNTELQRTIQWLAEAPNDSARPELLPLPTEIARPLRPPVTRDTVDVSPHPELLGTPPFDMWIVRTAERKEYGPVTLDTLSLWVAEGRLGRNCQILRTDWSQWKRVEKMFPELAEDSGLVKEFPEIKIQGKTANPSDP